MSVCSVVVSTASPGGVPPPPSPRQIHAEAPGGAATGGGACDSSAFVPLGGTTARRGDGGLFRLPFNERRSAVKLSGAIGWLFPSRLRWG